MAPSQITVLWINNHGGGFAETVQAGPGTTVGQFFEDHMGKVDPHDFLIRVNRQPCESSQVLKDQDRITASPVKVPGA